MRYHKNWDRISARHWWRLKGWAIAWLSLARVFSWVTVWCIERGLEDQDLLECAAQPSDIVEVS
jgi:hypothetical protein